jgi:hypothetical protein
MASALVPAAMNVDIRFMKNPPFSVRASIGWRIAARTLNNVGLTPHAKKARGCRFFIATTIAVEP